MKEQELTRVATAKIQEMVQQISVFFDKNKEYQTQCLNSVLGDDFSALSHYTRSLEEQCKSLGEDFQLQARSINYQLHTLFQLSNSSTALNHESITAFIQECDIPHQRVPRENLTTWAKPELAKITKTAVQKQIALLARPGLSR